MIKRRIILLMLALTPVLAGAQDAETATAEEAANWLSMLKTGGWPMLLLGAMSIAALAFIIYFFAVLRPSTVTPQALMVDLNQLIGSGRLEEAGMVCRKNDSPLSAVMLVGLDYIENAGKPDTAVLKEIMEGEGSRQADVIQQQTQYLLDIGAIAPMVGLLGTVIGMLKAFNSVALDIARAKPMVLAAGVSQALVTTAVGLIIAIPAMIFYAYFRGRAGRLIARLETVTARYMQHLSDHCAS